MPLAASITSERPRSRLDRLQALITEKCSSASPCCAPAQARGFDQVVLPLAHLNGTSSNRAWCPAVDAITRFPHQRIHQRGLAAVRPAAVATRGPASSLSRSRSSAQTSRAPPRQRAHAVACAARSCEAAEREFVNSAPPHPGHALGFVHRQPYGRHFPSGGDGPVGRHDAAPRRNTTHRIVLRYGLPSGAPSRVDALLRRAPAAGSTTGMPLAQTASVCDRRHRRRIPHDRVRPW